MHQKINRNDREKRMMENFIKNLAAELAIQANQVQASIALLEEGNTVPFIARYRKEKTGNTSDSDLRSIERALESYRSLQKRKEDIFSSLAKQAISDKKLLQAIENADNLSALEELYRPYRQKRETRADKAKKAGLMPLAKCIQDPLSSEKDIYRRAKDFLVDTYASVDACVEGAKDIVAEALAESTNVRQKLLHFLDRKVFLATSKGKEEDPQGQFSVYYDFCVALEKVKSYQFLAIQRAEKEGVLKFHFDTDEIDVPSLLLAFFQDKGNKKEFLMSIAKDAWKRLLKPSFENLWTNAIREKAEEEAMQVFSKNLESALLENPLPKKRVLALDPGYRNGCKCASVDAFGNFINAFVIYPLNGEKAKEEAGQKLLSTVDAENIDLLAIGNGTATRETEDFVLSLFEDSAQMIDYLIVNEAGASVYSASALAAEEFPSLDVALRSAVSLARRVQDPLAELVKVEPKALGLGQYQHDMNQKELERRLATVVEDCVNAVGCDVNTASVSLLQYVAGINRSIAENIVLYRQENGPFLNRKTLKKVARLGPKAYEQAAGFLRIKDGEEALDNTSIHPESYAKTRKLLSSLQIALEDFQRKDFSLQIRADEKEKLLMQTELGSETFDDIILALQKRGLDNREIKEIPKRNASIKGIEDLREGMTLPGVVRNVTQFGAFVDIGVHQDALVHISEISDVFVSDPHAYFHAGQNIKVKVIGVDIEKKRISLSTKGLL